MSASRILEHADHYERHAPPRNLSVSAPPLRFLEMGVQSGGSARMWRQWHGPRLTYVGIDIDPAAMRSQSPHEQIFIEIGSQANASFLRHVCATYGPFDVVVDDGGHTPELMRASISHIFPDASGCMRRPISLYVIEDTHTLLRASHTSGYASDMYNLVGEAFYALHAPNLPGPDNPHGRSKWHPSTQSILGGLPVPSSVPSPLGSNAATEGGGAEAGTTTGDAEASMKLSVKAVSGVSGGASSDDELVGLHPVFGDRLSAVHACASARGLEIPLPLPRWHRHRLVPLCRNTCLLPD